MAEVAATRLTERGATRADDRISEAGMEDRKKEGYSMLGVPRPRRPPQHVVEGVHRCRALRFATAGSVDDGKSTLIGRLLYDTEGHLRGPARRRRAHVPGAGRQYTNLALLTDGLRAEREQGITIDVAYRYFATPKRKFIIADTPGHTQYTRNMVTGASTADLALILIDARKGDAWSSPGATPSCRRCSASPTSSCASTRWTSSTGTRRSSSRSRTTSRASP